MEFLYGIREGVLGKVKIEKETDKQLKLDSNNHTGRTVVKKTDIDKVMGEGVNTVVFSTNENLIKEIWNTHIADETKRLERQTETVKSWVL